MSENKNNESAAIKEANWKEELSHVVSALVQSEMESDESLKGLTAEEYKAEFDKRYAARMEERVAADNDEDFSNVSDSVILQMVHLRMIFDAHIKIRSMVTSQLNNITAGNGASVGWLILGSCYKHAGDELYTLMRALSEISPKLQMARVEDLLKECAKRNIGGFRMHTMGGQTVVSVPYCNVSSADEEDEEENNEEQEDNA